MINIDEFLRFKARYEQFEGSHQLEIISHFKRDFRKFQRGYHTINSLVDELEKREAHAFNIFTVLDIGRYEVRTHTPFLAELLNPRGSHCQKNLFLCAFLKDTLNFCETDACHGGWYVIREEEHVDLKILNHTIGKAVFIENKVDSDAHSAQLSRYYTLWKEGLFKGRGAFIYLTPEGNEPSDAGFENRKYPKQVVMKDLKLFSYRTHIANWLERTLPLIQAPRVRETVYQYLQIIRLL